MRKRVLRRVYSFDSGERAWRSTGFHMPLSEKCHKLRKKTSLDSGLLRKQLRNKLVSEQIFGMRFAWYKLVQIASGGKLMVQVNVTS